MLSLVLMNVTNSETGHELEGFIAREIRDAVAGGKWNYRLSLLLTVLTVVSSATASLMAALKIAPAWTLAVVAIIPGIASALFTVLNCEAKARWFWQKCRALEALLCELRFENTPPREVSLKLRVLFDLTERSFPAFGQPPSVPKPPKASHE